jgi:hypothetical protein
MMGNVRETLAASFAIRAYGKRSELAQHILSWEIWWDMSNDGRPDGVRKGIFSYPFFAQSVKNERIIRRSCVTVRMFRIR